MQDEHDENEPLLHADVVAAGQYSGDEVADGDVVVATELEADGEDVVAGGEKLYDGELLLSGPALLLAACE